MATKRMAIKPKKSQPLPVPKSKSSARRAKARSARWALEVGETSVPGFGTTAGLRLTDRTVGLAEYSQQNQVRMPRIVSRDGGRMGSIDELKGSEFLGSISTGASMPAAGDLLARILINPSTFDNTRIQQFAKLYQRYRFKRAAIRYQADANSTQSGSIIGYMDYDVDNLVTSDDPVNIKRAAAHFAQEPSKIWQSQEFFLGIVDKFSTLFTNTVGGHEDRLVYQGVFYLIAATELPANSAIGTLYLDYECEFSIPAIEGPLSNEYLSLALQATGTPTTTSPFGDGAVEYFWPGYNLSNISYSEVAGQLTLRQIPAGNYQVMSSVALVGTNLNGANLVRSSVQVVSDNALWADSGTDLRSFTTYNVANNAGTEDGSFTGCFMGVLVLETYLEELVLDLTLGIPGNGLTFTDNSFAFLITKIPYHEVGMSGSKLLSLKGGRARKDTCLVLKPSSQKKNSNLPEKRLLGKDTCYQKPVKGYTKVFRFDNEDKVLDDSVSTSSTKGEAEFNTSSLQSLVRGLESEILALKRACSMSDREQKLD